MAVTFSGSMVSALPADVINSALREFNAIGAEETPSAADSSWALEKLQRIIDQANARREIIFSRAFQQYTLTANHGPHTIGPTGDFQAGPAANYRPVRIGSASFILNSGSTNPVDLPIRLRDKDWWAANPLKSLQSSVVTDLYYDAALPNGNLNFWPISNVASPVRLELWNSLGQALTLNGTTLSFAQGYWEWLILELAVALCDGFGRPLSPSLYARQQKAFKAIFANNDGPPRIDTNSGMPGSRNDGRPDFNFLTGMRE